MQAEIGASISALNSAWGDRKNQHITALHHAWDNIALISRVKSDDLKPVLQIVNEWLTSQDYRGLEGLTVLHKIVAQCSEAVFAEHISLWWQQVTGVLAKKHLVKLHSLALMVLRNLIRKSAQFQSVNRVNCSNVIPHIVESIKAQQTRIFALDCLQQCLIHYGGPCSTFKSMIESQLLGLVDGSAGLEQEMAAKCLAWLPTAGGGVTHQQTTWRNLQLRLIGSLHGELDTLFEEVAELPMALTVNRDTNLSLPPVTEKRPVARAQQLQLRIHNLCQYLTALLIEPVSVAKSVEVEELLQLVCRGLAVTGLSLGSAQLTIELQALRSILPSIHCSMFHVLHAVIMIMGKNLIPYQSTVFQLILVSLKWTSKAKQQSPGTGNAFSELRAATYHSLVLWMQQTQVVIGTQSEIDELMALAIPDITPQKEAVALRLDSKLGKARKRKQIADSILASEMKPQLVGDTVVCAGALESLAALLNIGGSHLKPEHHKMLHRGVMPAVLELQRGGPIHPMYEDPGTRMKLLELLLALVMQSHPLVSPPTSWAVMAFSAGQRSSDYQSETQDFVPTLNTQPSVDQDLEVDSSKSDDELQSKKRAKIVTVDLASNQRDDSPDITEVVTLDSAPSTPLDDNCAIKEVPLDNSPASSSEGTDNNEMEQTEEPNDVQVDVEPEREQEDVEENPDDAAEENGEIPTESAPTEEKTEEVLQETNVNQPEDVKEMIQDFVEDSQ
ncbi:hypothetical protein B566_EDAN010117 [Ephemera danica]|nr:hypothetical protein B566_EDAN010117 [Ephemera danica]